jgi:tRNA pseudouridine38-40 synthase
MARYFIRLSYLGARYSGFQIQDNAITIQSEVEKALGIYFRSKIELTGSSRTDAGVNAHNNYFHFDVDIEEEKVLNCGYHINAILPDDISIKQIFRVKDNAHCRFDATSRTYKYIIYKHKDPFLQNRGYYYPYPLKVELLNKAASLIKEQTDFATFSKKHVQVHNFRCEIMESKWYEEDDRLIYEVTGNRFLRGMVRGLVGTMLKIGVGKMSLQDFVGVVDGKDQTKADFSVPGYGLYLAEVKYDEEIHEK